MLEQNTCQLFTSFSSPKKIFHSKQLLHTEIQRKIFKPIQSNFSKCLPNIIHHTYVSATIINSSLLFFPLWVWQ